MIVGESPRPEDMDVNPTREKKLTNMRSSTSESTEKITPPASMSLEQMLEFIRQDECLEVTPVAVRMRKVELSALARGRRSKAAE
jgi:GTP-binding protein